MTRIKFVTGILCAYAAYYSVLILCDAKGQKRAGINVANDLRTGKPEPENIIDIKNEHKANGVLTHDTVLRSLWAYDNSDHKSLVHVRFDKPTVDLMNKFKMATGTDITKFVAFAVKYFLETNPEIKIIIKKFIQNTEL
ncbi:hypothetical protein G7092_16965 [Mucilaginibacter sp. HC2]|uniref:hypothetical protein n=1 Tax=Mucilaginibacter TaxID=423349 RepID=UPI000DCDE927|nr:MULTISPECIES: hypothetical protein [Mucilaginibacter]NHA05504.1 hypothetical protein [Mucilaginibacter inviolabilis]QTE35312.1 hypothetical protein J3L18_19440 [Mucilaginibacter gossypii]RAV59485.1 hypothetical protein DIU36_06555 [Mucilaginibacter rubeus]